MTDRSSYPNKPIVHEPVGRCIYCGSTSGKLSKEHIIPFGLGGNAILPRASCQRCAKITGALEQTCLRKMLGPLRVHRNLPTRRKKERPSSFALKYVHADGSQEIVDVPLKHYPINVVSLRLPPPEILRPPGMSSMADIWVKSLIHKSVRTRMRPGTRVDLVTAEIQTLARLYAKIAHSYAIAEWGYGTFTPLVVDQILNKRCRPFRYVGGSMQMPPPERGVLHKLESARELVGEREFLVVYVRLFCDMGSPRQTIVVGEFSRPQN